MSVKGSKYVLSAAEGHPKEFVDGLYNEAFDLHPAASEVDLAIAVRDTTTDDERKAGQVASFEVIDLRIMRVTDPAWDNYEGDLNASMHRYLDDSGHGEEGPLGMLREMVRWANSLGGKLIWIRKRPEDELGITPDLIGWHLMLAAIDFATGDGKVKTYRLGVVVNRDRSEPLPRTSTPTPDTGAADIDLAITEKLARKPIEKYNLPADHPYTLAAESYLRSARVIIGHEEEHGQAHHMAAHESMNEQVSIMGSEGAKMLLADPNISAKERKDAEQLLRIAEMVKSARDLVQENMVKPVAPQPIVDLPAPRFKSLEELFGLPASDNIQRPDKDLLN